MKPFLFINMAMTLDGKVSRPDGKWYGLNTISDKKKMDTIRAKADAIIVGKSSILNDDPVVTIRYTYCPKPPRPIILLQKSTLPKNRKIFSTNPIIFCTVQNYSKIQDELGDVSEIHCISDSSAISPILVIEKLVGLNYQKILLEGGPKLNYSFLAEDLVDKLYVTIVPFIIGKNTLPAIVDGSSEFTNFDKKKWKLISVEKEKEEIFLEYEKIF
ncbi:MAG: dihydrofolate reductase family protein [Leptospiraceae bacterium]|nr:dihydrofolate reductase family protein [Leptospiraceae bacterium]MCK6381392.1 dihydrofolate reductase family protein [Leptospiraceae bacterium]NUM42434.1 dihydrofolate reductase family protein [Leptospiraceae bacterium]